MHKSFPVIIALIVSIEIVIEKITVSLKNEVTKRNILRKYKIKQIGIAYHEKLIFQMLHMDRKVVRNEFIITAKNLKCNISCCQVFSRAMLNKFSPSIHAWYHKNNVYICMHDIKSDVVFVKVENISIIKTIFDSYQL